LPRIVVADAGPLIALARIDLLHLFARLRIAVYLPPTVEQECARDLAKPGARGIRAAIDDGSLLIKAASQFANLTLPAAMGAGEAEAIRLALELEAVVLLDDQLARKAANRAGLAVIGVSGLLLVAKQKKVIPQVGPYLKHLCTSGYRLSNRLVDEVLAKAGELREPPTLS
jgi:predicted nucleic acid-binding protein